jgi:hypothetical protein
MQLEADALVRGQGSGLDPCGEKISGRGLNRNVVANSKEIIVGLRVKDESQGTTAGVLLLGIEADLNIPESA